MAKTAIIAGAAAGGAVGLMLLVALTVLVIRRRQKRITQGARHQRCYMHCPEAAVEPPPYMIEIEEVPLVAQRQSQSYSPSRSIIASASSLPSEPTPAFPSAAYSGSGSGSRGDTLSSFASSHRDVVSPHLEETLRMIGYQPDIHPDRISADNWRRAGVDERTVDLLRGIYERYVFSFHLFV
jgi:hypothetical protein